MVRISVVIVNLNGSHLLADCLGSLAAQTFRDFEVIFVDNGSSDDSVEKARDLFAGVKVIALDSNRGFAAANNLGFAQAIGQYVVVLNNDTRLDAAFLERLIAAVDTDERVGMVAPKILNFFQPDIIDSVGGLVFCPDGIAQGRGRGEVDRGQHDDLTTIVAPSACAALYRRAMLDQVGGFDETFFAYCEDSDLALRAQWAGWKAVSAPRAVVYHKYSTTAGPYSPLKLYLVERNHFVVAARNFPLRWLMAVPFWTALRYAGMAYVVLRREGKGNAVVHGGTRLIAALLKGQLCALFRIPAALSHRSAATAQMDHADAVENLLRRNRLSIMKMLRDS